MPGGAGVGEQGVVLGVAGGDDEQRALLCDPQTSGGLLIAVEAHGVPALEAILREAGIAPVCIGELHPRQDGPWVEVI